MRTEVILHENILGTVIDWTAGTAFANATQMGTKYGKLPAQFLRLEVTQAYAKALAKHLGLLWENPIVNEAGLLCASHTAKLRDNPSVYYPAGASANRDGARTCWHLAAPAVGG